MSERVIHRRPGNGDGRVEQDVPRSVGRRRSGRRNEALIGIVIVLGVAALFFGVRFLEGRPFLKGTYRLVTELPASGGVGEGSDVRISGVKVGEVTRLELDPVTHRVTIELGIRDGIAIPQGSYANVRGIEALDDVHLAITTPESRAGAPLADGDRIPARSDPGLAQRADSTLAEVDETFERAQSLLTTTETGLTVVLANMQSATGEAAALMQAERERLHATVALLHETVTRLNDASNAFDRIAETGGDTLLVAMDRLSQAMRRLDAAATSLERGSADVERVMATVDSGSGTLGRLVNDPTLYARLDSAAARLDSAAARLGGLLEDFQNDPGRYLKHMELIDVF
ncbi:MAG TPA: MlaD family protein [Rhodothermales bacterium]